ncbi:MAG: ABC transporter permease, partial [Acidobacteria bacterium]|nr:ABC transporter permease [Acidobacteriota bacterium]
MNVPFELHVALRYLLARRKQAFISVISLISTLGVIVGVMALIIALALMTGLQGELRDRILGSTAHVFVYVVKPGGIVDYREEARALRAMPHVRGAAPAILGKALITTSRGEAFITIKGIDPVYETEVTDIARALRSGSLTSLVEQGADDAPGILLGVDLARQLGVAAGDAVTVLTPQGTLSPMGMLPRTRRMRVAGVFSLGLFEFDSAYGFVSLPVAMRLTDRDRVELMELRVDDIYRAPAIAEAISLRADGRYLTEPWTELNRALFSALWLEKMAISITIGLIVMVAALNIVASLILLVMEKHSDIAILKTMGASSRSIMTVFMLQGLIIGVTGTALGTAGGYGLSYLLDRYKVVRVPIDVYQIAYVPFTLMPLDVALVIVASLAICFLATIH